MSGKTLVFIHKFKLPLALCAALVLAACEDGKLAFPSGNSDDDVAVSAIERGPLVERDVEAPEAFQITEAGLWDGRPSLGGVWVAHPDVTEPERVIIRNPSNGTSVIGALFRRERENPGPSLQVSSDAAAELGMLAGAPAQLQVTALRREESVAGTDGQAAGDFEAPTDISATPISSAPLDTPASGAAIARDAAAAITATPAPNSGPTPSGGSLSAPFIQIGIFSIEANADSTADRLRTAGVTPRVLEQESQGRPFWRVIVGPATSEADRAQDLQTVKSLGFDDAYFVTN